VTGPRFDRIADGRGAFPAICNGFCPARCQSPNRSGMKLGFQSETILPVVRYAADLLGMTPLRDAE
jgi:hypothetical protein